MDWPTALPKPLADGYGFDPDSGLLRTNMESGTARVRLRYRDGPDTVSVVWRFKLAEMVTFRSFFKTDLYNGSAWFNVAILDGTATTPVTRAARFIGDSQTPPYRAKLIGQVTWEVSAKLEVRSA